MFDTNVLPTPSYVVDEKKLIENLEKLQAVAKKANCKILLAQKAFSMFSVYPLISQYLDGTEASGLYEAKLGREQMPTRENHVFCAAYRDDEFDEILTVSDHIVFNSFNQWKKFREKSIKSGKSFGIRINPEFSTQNTAIYDPCAPFSRLGVTKTNFESQNLEGIDGLHFHTLCEQGSEDLAKTVEAVEEKFGEYSPKMKWVNFGGGHHITKDGYDIDLLIETIKNFKNKYGVEVYLEPGEAIALNAGYLVTTVLDIIKNNMNIALLDASAACHMPDVIEMPYRPPLLGSGKVGEKPYDYRLAGATCLAGDIIGDYSFDKELSVGEKLIFADMAIYTMVKNNTFNGMPLPSIYLLKTNGEMKLIKKFGYLDFKNRLS
ncbi:MAG TPA: carboxynorspermidine decarboxylase [Clostridia bacterium]|nr:carboxynorspermidine decarboxylase [Clostridia bacterium]